MNKPMMGDEPKIFLKYTMLGGLIGICLAVLYLFVFAEDESIIIVLEGEGMNAQSFYSNKNNSQPPIDYSKMFFSYEISESIGRENCPLCYFYGKVKGKDFVLYAGVVNNTCLLPRKYFEVEKEIILSEDDFNISMKYLSCEEFE